MMSDLDKELACLDLAVDATRGHLEDAYAELGRKLQEVIEPCIATFSRLSETAGLSSAVFKKLMEEYEAARSPGPRQVFSGALVAVGAGPIGIAQFRLARPANRRPVLPGYMTQKGKG